MHYEYTTKGTCSRTILFDLEDGKVHNVQFVGGCNGNLKAEDVIDRVAGIQCGMKSTSCPDQLSVALKQALAEAK